MYEHRRNMLVSMIQSATKYAINIFLNIIKTLLIIVGAQTIMQSQEPVHSISRPATPTKEFIEKNNHHLWKNDELHSSIIFSIDHMGISKIYGRFDKFNIMLITPAYNKKNNFSNSSVKLIIDAGSINTQNSDRDNHLKTRDFLSTDIHSNIELNAILHESKKENVYDVVGTFYLNGVERKIKLKALYNGTINNINGETVSMFKIKGKINRKHHNVIWNKILDNGGLLIGDMIDFEANIQMIQQPIYK